MNSGPTKGCMMCAVAAWCMAPSCMAATPDHDVMSSMAIGVLSPHEPGFNVRWSASTRLQCSVKWLTDDKQLWLHLL